VGCGRSVRRAALGGGIGCFGLVRMPWVSSTRSTERARGSVSARRCPVSRDAASWPALLVCRRFGILAQVLPHQYRSHTEQTTHQDDTRSTAATSDDHPRPTSTRAAQARTQPRVSEPHGLRGRRPSARATRLPYRYSRTFSTGQPMNSAISSSGVDSMSTHSSMARPRDGGMPGVATYGSGSSPDR